MILATRKKKYNSPKWEEESIAQCQPREEKVEVRRRLVSTCFFLDLSEAGKYSVYCLAHPSNVVLTFLNCESDGAFFQEWNNVLRIGMFKYNFANNQTMRSCHNGFNILFFHTVFNLSLGLRKSLGINHRHILSPPFPAGLPRFLSVILF